jgi:hypothetical protein
MTGFLIGLACGAGELFLLTRLTKALLAGNTLQTLGFALGKIMLLAAALVSVTVWFRDDLVWCGVGVSSVLVIGAFVINLLKHRNGKGEK